MPKFRLCLTGIGLWLLGAPLHAYDVNDTLSIGGIAAGAWQCQELTEDAGASDACRGALPLRPRLLYKPTQQDTLYIELGFAAGNGLNAVSPFQLAPWAADLEDDVKNINDRGRNYLLTAWYRHHFQFSKKNSLTTTLGIIDSTDYLDNNAFANDEFTQFMNEAFVNAPQVFLPSYDWGAAAQWDHGRWSLRAVFMNVGKDDGEDPSDAYNFLGFEAGYSTRTRLGEGNFRILFTGTSKDFPDPTDSSLERLATLAISFDQELGKGVGVFLRMGSQADKAAVDYKNIGTGGLDIRGNLWGREHDNIGLGIGYLQGGNLNIDSVRVAEAYYRFVINEGFALTADLQYMRDDKRVGRDPEGYILGLRADVHF